MPQPSLKRAWLALPIVAALLAGAGAAQKGAWGIRHEISEALQRVEAWSDVPACREELLALGRTALPELFALFVSGPQGDELQDFEGLAPLDLPQRFALESAIAGFPEAELHALLARSTEADESRRIAALRILARAGSRNDLSLIMELATGNERDARVSPALRAAFEDSLLAIHSRDASLPRALSAVFGGAPPALQPSIVSILGRSGTGAAGQLAGLLGKAPAADGLILLEIGRVAPPAGEREDLVLERVRGYVGHPDPKLAILAVLAVEKLADQNAVPDFIALLDHADANVRREVHRGLMRLTGLSIESDARAWMEWLDGELTWWQERAPACREALGAESAFAAAAAVYELANRHLYRDQAAELLLLGLERDEPDIVESTCRALGALRSRAALPALTVLMEDDRTSVRSEARRAVQRISGLTLPASASAWRSRLEPVD